MTMTVKILQGNDKHSVFTLPQAEAALLVERGIAKELSKPVEVEVKLEQKIVNLDELTLNELRHLAKQHNVAATGNAKTLRKRIREEVYGM